MLVSYKVFIKMTPKFPIEKQDEKPRTYDTRNVDFIKGLSSLFYSLNP